VISSPPSREESEQDDEEPEVIGTATAKAQLKQQRASQRNATIKVAQKKRDEKRKREVKRQEVTDVLPEGLLQVLGSMGTPESLKKMGKNRSKALQGKQIKKPRAKKRKLERRLSDLWQDEASGITVKRLSSRSVDQGKGLSKKMEGFLKRDKKRTVRAPVQQRQRGASRRFVK